MIKDWKFNPKTKGSGIITAIPQTGTCPNKCDDCFFQSGRSYLEPLEENLPHLPLPIQAEHRIVRVNDGNDSGNNVGLVREKTKLYKHKFYNTAIPRVLMLKEFSDPIVLTINPGTMTDINFFYPMLYEIPDNLMFVRIRVNTWNIKKVVIPAVDYYTKNGVVVVLTFMAYYKKKIPLLHRYNYGWKKRTLNSYWCLKQKVIDKIMHKFKDNPLVYSCGVKGRHECKFCGNCVREYHNAIERIYGVGERQVL